MKKILIVGSKGMLGQELVEVFKKDKRYEVIAWNRKELDITKEKEVASRISKLKPSIIINSAAYNAVDKCEADKKEFESAKKINGRAPGYLAKAAKKIGALLVHYSSDYVFDGHPEIQKQASRAYRRSRIGFNEKIKPNPINNYGKSKLMGEREVAKNTKKY